MKVLVVQSTVRKENSGRDIANWVYDTIKEQQPTAEVEFIDVKTLNLALDDEPYIPRFEKYTQNSTKAWSKKVKESDALVFVVPEYNGSYPASFKNAIDHLANEWKNKLALIVAYSPSGALSVVPITETLLNRIGMILVPSLQIKTFDLGYVAEPGLIEQADKLRELPYHEQLVKSIEVLFNTPVPKAE